jgi:hypothetical protein
MINNGKKLITPSIQGVGQDKKLPPVRTTPPMPPTKPLKPSRIK